MYKVLTYTGTIVDHHVMQFIALRHCVIQDSYGLKLAMLMGMGNTMVESCSVEMPVRVWR